LEFKKKFSEEYLVLNLPKQNAHASLISLFESLCFFIQSTSALQESKLMVEPSQAAKKFPHPEIDGFSPTIRKKAGDETSKT